MKRIIIFLCFFIFINIIMTTVKIPDGHPSFEKLTLKDTIHTGLTIFPADARVKIGDAGPGVIATRGYVLSQIDALVGSAPQTLNTLQELATSLGDVVDFKGYLDGALALKATLNGTETLRNKTLADGNGNELVVFGQTTNAVNEIKISNAAANLGPTIETQGGSPNVDLNISTKGTGKVNITSDVVIVAGKTLTGNVNGNATTATDYNTGSGTIKSALDSLNFTNLITTSTTPINLPTKSARYYIRAENVVLNVPAIVEPGTTFTIFNDLWKYKIGRPDQSTAEKLEPAAYTMSTFIATNATQWKVYIMPIPGTSNF